MASEVVRIICPNLKCKAILSVPSSARGKTVRCRQCGSRVGVPELIERPAPTPVGAGNEAQNANGNPSTTGQG